MGQLVRGRLRALVPLLCALLVVAASGCRHRAQEAPAATAPGASLVATSDYGAHELLSTRVGPRQSVMRALRGATEVKTAYAGGFVSGMLGLSSDLSGPHDWFFFVNGIVSPVGAKDVDLADGDAVWWDHRNWEGLLDTPAVVGQWPAPLVLPGRRGRAVSADPPLRAALRAAGATLVAGDSPWRARVGSSEDLARRDPAWARALADPNAAGLTVAVRDGAIVARGPDGPRRVVVPGARALVAAVPTGRAPQDGVLVAVAGLDEASARAAARTIVAHPEVLRLRYALAFDANGTPLVAGGRIGP